MSIFIFFNFLFSLLIVSNYRTIGNGSELKEKYLRLFELCEKMTSSQKYKRPDCEEILKDKNLWALSLSALESNTDFQSKRMKYSEDIFYLHFIEMKSRMRLDLDFSHKNHLDSATNDN